MHVNDRELRVIGMSRSGNHAILQWIMAQASGRVCFLNATQANYNPFLTAQPMSPDDPHGAVVSYEGFDLAREQRGRFSRKDLLIYSHEDEPLGRVGSRNFERYHDGFVGRSRVRLDVLILRDPFNLFASRRRSGFCPNDGKGTVRLWKQHAREFLRLTQYLPYGPALISFNHWARSGDYRRGIAHSLGLHFTDANSRTVAGCAGGSSFDGLQYRQDAAQMRVLDRWRSYAEDPAFRELFDEDMLALSERIFGCMPGTELLPLAGQLDRAG